MASEIKVEVIHRETVKPSTPTSNQLRSPNLSVFDQLIPEIYVPLLLFYPANTDQDDDHQVPKIADRRHSLEVEKSKLLRASLSETLTHFHPFAGTIQDNVSISCNDRGAAFTEARVNCPLSKILVTPDLGMLKQLITDDFTKAEDDTGFLLLFQVNFFECGGMAIGVSFSHKMMDAYTLNTFLNSWAKITFGLCNGTTDRVMNHLPDSADQFGAAATLFPPLEFLKQKLSARAELFVTEKCVTKRFVFDASKIVALKSRSASATVPNPTRVEVVSSLIWKCLMEASRSNCGSIRPSAWCQAVNLRRVLSKQQQSLMGNLVGRICTVRTEAENDDLQGLVGKLRKGIEEFKLKYGSGVIPVKDACRFLKEYGELMNTDGIIGYGSTSWCRFALYEADFGWGKPLWMCMPTNVQIKNIISFMDTRDGGGIDARLTLKEEDMAILESNHDLLAYASLNPTVI